MNEFYVLVNSEASKDIYVNNTSTSFVNVMPHNIQLNEKWQVALQSVCVETSFYTNVPKEVNKTNKHFIHCDDNSIPLFITTIPDKIYTVQSMLDFLHTSFFANIVRRTRIITSIIHREDMITFRIQLTRGQLRINEDVCKWLNIDTEGYEVVEDVGADYYFEEIVNPNIYERVRVVLFQPEQHQRNGINIDFNLRTFPNLIPSMIKVKLDEMKQSLSSSGNHKDLAIAQFKAPQDYVSFYHEVIKKEYFPLNSNLLQTLSVKLTDEDNDELRIRYRHPTFIKLKFKSMSGSAFILRVSSRDSNNIYPENTAANFRTQLPKLMSLTGQNWQVALSSIIYPSQILLPDYLSKQDLWIRFEKQDADQGEFIFRYELNLKNERILTYEDLVYAINTNSYRIHNRYMFRIRIDRNTLLVTYSSRRILRITVSPILASILGLNTHQFVTNQDDDNVEIGTADIKRCMPNTLSVHTDFTSPIVAGGKYCRLLKFIPILQDLQATDGSVMSTVSYESHHMDFVNLSTTELQSLQFQLRDGVGKPLVFENNDNNAVTFINLLFQKQ